MTTREQVARWRALAEAATPGPWAERPDLDGAKDSAFIAASREAVPSMAAMIAGAAALAEALEWAGEVYEAWPCCPLCGGTRDVIENTSLHAGHERACALAAFLDEWRGDAPGGDA